MIEYSSAHINGIDLSYYAVGDGPALVFLHGFGANHLAWWRQIPAFADTYHCLAPDQRMFGRSPDAADGPGAAAMADDLTALLDYLDIDEAAVVGQSMGGWPAASFATQHPDRTAALVLSATPGGLLTPDEHAALIEGAETSGEVDPLTPELSFLSDAIDALNTDRPAEFTDIRPALDGLPLAPERIVDAGVPAFLITGGADDFMPREAMGILSERLDDAPYTIVDDAGHCPYYNQSKAFNEAVETFLDEKAQF
ncbi:MAG: 3-oxoadipate enol-lactonase [Natronomonas sp.]|jgi:3-oxoadipate enol-lactonase